MMVALNVVIVAVSSLLYDQIIPLGGVRIVTPLNHAVEQVISAFRETVQNAVDRVIASAQVIGAFGPNLPWLSPFTIPILLSVETA